MSVPSPSYRIILDGTDITPAFNPRLISLNLSEARSDEADQLDITLTDHDGLLEMPRKGVKLELQLGYSAGGLVDKGSYIVDEVEHSGPPDIITLRARSAELTQTLRSRNDRSWHSATLGSIVKSIASNNHLKVSIDASLASQPISHIDQTGESDIAFITRLARRFDAVATVKAGTLIFLTINDTVTAQGNTLPRVTLRRSDTQNHRYIAADRESYTGVRAHYTNIYSAQRESVLHGKDENVKELAEVYADKEEAKDAAKSEWQRIERSTTTLSLTLAVGMPELMPQTVVMVTGFKEEVNQVTWLAVGVKHALNGSGLITSVEMERLG